MPIRESALRALVYEAIDASPTRSATVDEMYEFVAARVKFDAKDLEPPTLRDEPVNEPGWKRNLRNALQAEKRALRLVNIAPAVWRRPSPLPPAIALPRSSARELLSLAKAASRGTLVLRDPITSASFIIEDVGPDSIMVRNVVTKRVVDVTLTHLETAIDRLNAAGGTTGRGTLHKTLARELVFMALHPALQWTNDGRGITLKTRPGQTTETRTAVEAGRTHFPGPPTSGDERQWVERMVALRQGQPAFRRDLLLAYEGSCAFTGTGVAACLQAAHIRPRRGAAWDVITNGLLLRADVHTLFDLGLLGVDGHEMVVAEDLLGTDYVRLQGNGIRQPRIETNRPDPDALQWHLTEVFARP